MKTLIFALMLVSIVTMANSKEITVPYKHIADYSSHSGETEVQFLHRIAPEMVSYSAKYEVETCGVIGRRGDAYSIMLGTNGSHIGCVFDPLKTLNGYLPIDRIHSHVPDTKTYLLSAVDAKLANIPNPMTPVRIKIDSTTQFSAWDYGSSGYLAIPGGVLYEHGQGTSALVK